MSEIDDSLSAACDLVGKARRVFVLTGAGISAESGVPTFRSGGNSLVWRGMPFEVLSSAEMVRRDLLLVWEWFDYRRGGVGKCEPNRGHLAIAEAAQSGRFADLTLVTQNIDGLHRAAGSEDVIELHGDINFARCARCETLRELTSIPEEERPPICSSCSSLMRPHVVLFGENLPIEAILEARTKAAACDVCLVVGTSALVYPANEMPHIAALAGASVIEVNPEATVLTPHCDVSVRGTASNVLPALLCAANSSST